ncbi:MAG: PHP domain-containing protein [Anaerolineaceae bacterium]|nr:PHP domain-containing protein [Anaerolineaceae bacterium]
MWKIDFHSHTRFSKDSLAEISQLIEKANKIGLDKIIVTDHNTIVGALIAQEMFPDKIIVGEEILTTRGELLACFLTREVPKGLEPAEAIRQLKAQGAFISVSHPFDLARHGWLPQDLDAIINDVDAIEVFNARCLRQETNRKAMEYARLHNVPGTVGSDAHMVSELGTAFLELEPFKDAESLRKVIRAGKINSTYSPFWVHFGSTWAKVNKKLFSKKNPS